MAKAITIKMRSKSLRKLLVSGDKPARLAAVDAINLAVRSQMKLVYRKTAAELKIPQKFIRARTHDSKARPTRPSYVVKATTWPINIATLGAQVAYKGKTQKGTPRQAGLTTDSRHGSVKAPHAFLRMGPKGTLRAYERKGSSRKPLALATLDVHDVIDRRLRQMNKRALKLAMLKHYPKQLKFRASKLGKSRLMTAAQKGQRGGRR